MFYLAIVNKILRHCHSWLARQYIGSQQYAVSVDILYLLYAKDA